MPEIPGGAKQPMDRLQKESDPRPVTLTLTGKSGSCEATILPQDEWDFDVMDHFYEGRFGKAVAGLVSPEDAQAITDARPNMRQIGDFLTAAMSAVGADAGEGRAS